jgi:hypothetical protein
MSCKDMLHATLCLTLTHCGHLCHSAWIEAGVHVLSQAHQQDGSATLLLECELHVPPGSNLGGNLHISLPGLEISLKADCDTRVATDAPAVEDSQFVRVEVVVPAGKAQLWYPAGYGSQPLYDLKVVYVPLNVEPSACLSGVNSEQFTIAQLFNPGAIAVGDGGSPCTGVTR